MEKKKISVILPVYNAQKFLHHCLDSILTQSYEHLEVLIIEDGSTDDTLKICRRYERMDPRIRVLHKENGGVAAARQLGLEQMTGDYAIQLDSDDYIDQHMLEDMMAVALQEDADIVYTDYFETQNGKDRLISQNMGTDNPVKLIQKNIEGTFFGVLWNKLIRCQLFTENGIHFDPQIRYSEDSLILIKLLLRCHKVVYLPKAYYHYVFVPDSLSRNITLENFRQRMCYLQALREVLDHSPLGQSDSILAAYGNLRYHNLSRALHSHLYSCRELRELFPDLMNPLLIRQSDLKWSNRIKIRLLSHKMDFILKHLLKLPR